jgi:hypothetical protein
VFNFLLKEIFINIEYLNNMKKLFINKDIYLINILALIIGCFVYVFFNQKIEILGAVMATGISISFGVRQYKIENDKVFKELFKEFNNRYDNVFNDLLNKLDEDRGNKTVLELNEKLKVMDYINMCAEEYLWYKKGRIPEEVWKAWKNGIEYYAQIPSINKVFVEQSSQRDSYYGLFDDLKLNKHN